MKEETKPKPKRGPPTKAIDWTQFEQACALQCTQEETASFLKVHRHTLSAKVKEHYQEDYSTVYKRFSESGKCSLRRNQFVLSKKNASMAIWLGKIWLGQKEDSGSQELLETFSKLLKASNEQAIKAELTQSA